MRIGKIERCQTGMPTYSFVDTETGDEFDLNMKYSEREEFLKENPSIQVVMTAPMIVSGVSIGASGNKLPNGFKEVLSKIGEAHPTSKVGQQYGSKTIKSVRTEQIIKKHVEKITKRTQGK